ncbi:MAG: glycosyltransferase, partial [Tepidimonas sp.]|uniref:glycosyltransferase n=1 Tax=Tepidimonas sp. TaxID=2002775 RepID=UPI00298EE051
QLLRGLMPHVRCGLVAAASPQQPDSHLGCPYPVWVSTNLGKWDAVTLSPTVLVHAWRLLWTGQVSLLHVHLPNPWADLIVQGAPARVPVVASWHSDIVRQKGWLKLYRPLQRATLRRASRIIVATTAHWRSSTQLKGHDIEAKIAVVPYGVDLAALTLAHADPAMMERIQAFAAGRPVIATVGRHIYYKGYPWLLEALASMQTNAVLVMVGQGPLTPQLQQQALWLGVGQRVLWLGGQPRASMIAALQACDVFTLPSVEPSEAFGLASAEAMACGKPTVVCALGNGVEELNRHGHTSLVVPPRDPAALARALDTLLQNHALRRRMGDQARQWVATRYSVDSMVAATLDVYRDLIGP